MPLEILISAILGIGATGAVSSAVAAITRRFTEPTQAEVSQAEALASEAWVKTGGGGSNGGPVSPDEGDREAARILAAFAADLRDEAGRIAKRVGATAPSPTHVRLAADRIGILRQRTSALADVGLASGGIVLGGAVAYWINLQTGGNAAPGSKVWVIVAGAAGLTAFVIAATVKVVRR